MVEQAVISDEVKQELADASLKRIKIIYDLVKEYFRAISGNLNPTEFTLIGLDVIQAGLAFISRSNDMDNADVDTRIEVMNGIKELINRTIETTYTNPEVVAKQVANASVEQLQRSGMAKNLKKEDK